jgi:hypothetical protein
MGGGGQRMGILLMYKYGGSILVLAYLFRRRRIQTRELNLANAMVR